MLGAWSDFAVLLKSDLDVQQTHLWDWYVVPNLILSPICKCDQIYKWQDSILVTLCCAVADLDFRSEIKLVQYSEYNNFQSL